MLTSSQIVFKTCEDSYKLLTLHHITDGTMLHSTHPTSETLTPKPTPAGEHDPNLAEKVKVRYSPI